MYDGRRVMRRRAPVMGGRPVLRLVLRRVARDVPCVRDRVMGRLRGRRSARRWSAGRRCLGGGRRLRVSAGTALRGDRHTGDDQQEHERCRNEQHAATVPAPIARRPEQGEAARLHAPHLAPHLTPPLRLVATAVSPELTLLATKMALAEAGSLKWCRRAARATR
jgi:hypothetical protein